MQTRHRAAGRQADTYDTFLWGVCECLIGARSGSHVALGTQTGILIACPIHPDDAAEAAKVERATQTALKELKCVSFIFCVCY